MEKIGLSFLIGAVIGASFKTSVRGVKDNIGEIHSQVKRLTEERNTLLSKKYDTQSNFFKNDAERILKINKEIERLTNLKTINLKFRSNVNELKSSVQSLMKFGGVVSAGALVAARPIKIAVDFESSMLKVKSVVNGITEEEFKALNDEAKRLGAETSFSASEAAEGMKYLAMAGFNSNQIISSMPGLLDMAKAGVIDLGRASDISSNILSAFGISANEMGRVADTLTMAFTTSNTTLESLGYTMKYVGPIARDAGMSLEEAAAMAGLLGNIGIQGEMAGTQLRAMINRLSAPVGPAQKKLEELGITVKDSTGNLRPMIELLAEMENKTANMGSADRLATFKTIFGEEAVSGLSELVNQAGKGGISKYLDIVKNSSGKAAEVAKIQMSGLGGALDELSSSLEGVAISFGEIMIPAIKSSAEILKTVSSGINNLIENHGTLIKVLFHATSGVIAFISGYKIAVVAVNLFNTVSKYAQMQALALGLATSKASIGVKLLAVAQAGLNTVMNLNPIARVVGALVAAGFVAYKVVKNWDKIKEYFSGLWEGIKNGFYDAVEAIKPAIDFVGKAVGKLLIVKRAVTEGVTWVGNKTGLTDKEANFNLDHLTRTAWEVNIPNRNNAKTDKLTEPAWDLSKNENVKPVSDQIYNNPSNNYNNINNMNAPVNYSPNITINGPANKNEIQEAAKLSQKEFEKMYKQQTYNNARLSYVSY